MTRGIIKTGWGSGGDGARASRAELSSSQPLLVALVADIVLAAWGATQFLASRLGYQPTLGAWLYVASPHAKPWWRAMAVLIAGAGVVGGLVLRTTTGPFRRWTRTIVVVACLVAVGAWVASRGPVYPPTRLVLWAVAYHRVPAAAPLVEAAVRVFGVSFVGLLAATLLARPQPRRRVPSASHGSAEWGNGDTLEAEVGFELGRIGSGKHTRVLRYGGDGHVITVAPTRSGKGVSCVIPNLLHYPGSVIVTDPKGENHAVTARRRRELGSVVHALDPFDVVGGTAAFNPVDLVDGDGPDANDDAWMLADMLVVPEGKGGDHTFWNEEARALLAGLVLHVATNAPPELRTLTHVRELLTLPPDPFQLLLKDMSESDSAGGLVARAASRLLQKAERERSGVISSAQSHTHFLDSPRMARVMGHSSVDLAEVKRGCVSLYLVLPPERMDTYRRWLRLTIACALLAMTRTPGRPRRRVLFLLDEFANLGRMEPVQRDISLAGAYGSSFWLLLQDLSQLKGTYPDKWETFLANADVLQAFGINDWETAEYLSKMTGETTILVDSENVSAGVSRGRSASRQQSAAQTTSEKGRRLLLPDEVRRMTRETELLFVRGGGPVRAERISYLRDSEYAGQYDPNPMHDSSPPIPSVQRAEGQRGMMVDRTARTKAWRRVAQHLSIPRRRTRDA